MVFLLSGMLFLALGASSSLLASIDLRNRVPSLWCRLAKPITRAIIWMCCQAPLSEVLRAAASPLWCARPSAHAAMVLAATAIADACSLAGRTLASASAAARTIQAIARGGRRDDDTR